MGRTQRGNNNAYCIDDDTTWLDWSLREEYGDLLAFTRRLLALRHANPVFRQRRFFEGRPVVPDGRKDLAWFAATGREMTEDAWHDESLRTLGMFLAGDGIRSRGLYGERIVGESFLLWLHADPDPVEVRLPGSDWAERYDVVLDTSVAEPEADGTAYAAGDPVTVPGRSCLLLQAAP